MLFRSVVFVGNDSGLQHVLLWSGKRFRGRDEIGRQSACEIVARRTGSEQEDETENDHPEFGGWRKHIVATVKQVPHRRDAAIRNDTVKRYFEAIVVACTKAQDQRPVIVNNGGRRSVSFLLGRKGRDAIWPSNWADQRPGI